MTITDKAAAGGANVVECDGPGCTNETEVTELQASGWFTGSHTVSPKNIANPEFSADICSFRCFHSWLFHVEASVKQVTDASELMSDWPTYTSDLDAFLRELASGDGG